MEVGLPGGETGSALDLTTSAMDKVMENDMLLGRILESVEDFYNLRKARQICSKWKNLATEILRERNWTDRKFLTFYSEDIIQEYLATFTQSKENIMFTCFFIEPDKQSQSHSYALWLNRFFQAFPNSIKSLDFHMAFNSPVQFESILQSQANSLTELKIEITIDGEPVFGFDMDFAAAPVDFYLTSLKYFCTQSECVMSEDRTLHQLNLLESVLYRIPPENKRMFKLCIIESDKIKQTVALLQKYDLVKSLKLLHTTDASKGDLTLLKNSGVELEHLVTEALITYKDATGDREFEEGLWVQGIYDYLCYQSKTLKILEWESKSFKFPPWGMPGMTELKLTYHQPPAAPGQNQNQNPIIIYSDLFPNLQDLRLYSGSGWRADPPQNPLDFQSMFLPLQFPFTALQKLKVGYSGINAQIMTSLSSIFPRIKSLDIGHYVSLSDEEQLNFYSALWNAEFKFTVEELVIRFEKFYADGERTTWRQFELFSLFSGVREEDIGEDQDLSSVLGDSSICNYTNLRKVELFVSKFNYTISGGFGEKAALSIFSKIEKLEYLYIDPKICKFSADGLKSLRKLNNSSNSTQPSSTSVNGHPIQKMFNTEFDRYSIEEDSKNLLK